MTINKDLWKSPFATLPDWPCPSCRLGTLSVTKSTLNEKETGPSERLRSEMDEAWDPEHYEGRFVAHLSCGRCQELVVVCGDTRVAMYFTDDEVESGTVYRPRFCHPSPPLFRVSNNCPKDAREELSRAFGLYWCDRGASANAMRSAIECVLNHQKVKKKTRKNGRLRPLTLHDRIVAFRTKNADAAACLEAIKWIGNDGSHPGKTLSDDNLLSGFELFEHALDLLYVKTTRKLAETAKAIIKKKGLAKKRSQLDKLLFD